MAIRLLRTEAALELCQNHLDSTDSTGTEIESYLTQYLLIVFCAEIEHTLTNMIIELAEASADARLGTFTKGSIRKVLRSIRKNELAGFIALFGDEKKAAWENDLMDRDVTKYMSAVLARHKIAHAQGATLTFQEIKQAVESSYRILESFHRSLHA